MAALRLLSLCLIVLPCCAAPERPDSAQHPDPLVQQKLAWWQDLKFGLMMHWGPYSQWGIVESWSLCSEDEPWCRRDGDDYAEYKRRYEALKATFNPVRFAPETWAEAARAAGMGYVVFTTKHHDGFCMFDSAQTDYKVTDPGCAFHSSPRADIAKEIFDAFRSAGLGIGAYFSKPDWHSRDYWWPYFATPDRHVNYDPAKYPDRWKRFQDFTYAQIEELMTRYGPIDILWLDGAWVRPIENMPAEYEPWARKRDWDQDIDMARIAAMARGHQPGLLVVDRWVAGQYEDYLTPEQRVPERPLLEPWESCLTMGSSWSFTPTDRMKSVRELVHVLVDVVAKGGNLLLNVGVGPDGAWPEAAYDRLRGIAAWMDINGPAIHGSRPLAPHKVGHICYTRGTHGDRYAILLAAEGQAAPPPELWISNHRPGVGGRVLLLGHPEPLEWEAQGGGCLVRIPAELRASPPCQDAWVFRIAD